MPRRANEELARSSPSSGNERSVSSLLPSSSSRLPRSRPPVLFPVSRRNGHPVHLSLSSCRERTEPRTSASLSSALNSRPCRAKLDLRASGSESRTGAGRESAGTIGRGSRIGRQGGEVATDDGGEEVASSSSVSSSTTLAAAAAHVSQSARRRSQRRTSGSWPTAGSICRIAHPTRPFVAWRARRSGSRPSHRRLRPWCTATTTRTRPTTRRTCRAARRRTRRTRSPAALLLRLSARRSRSLIRGIFRQAHRRRSSTTTRRSPHQGSPAPTRPCSSTTASTRRRTTTGLRPCRHLETALLSTATRPTTTTTTTSSSTSSTSTSSSNSSTPPPPPPRARRRP